MKDFPTVLYAEDDENDVFFMERAFAKLTVPDRLRIVLNGREAVDYLCGTGRFGDRERFPLPGLVVLDVKMPEMSGLETLSWIRARREYDALPIVMFTSSTQSSDVTFSRDYGANAYLVKPSNAEHLHRLMDNIIDAMRTRASGASALAIEGNQL